MAWHRREKAGAWFIGLAAGVEAGKTRQRKIWGAQRRGLRVRFGGQGQPTLTAPRPVPAACGLGRVNAFWFSTIL